MIKSVDLAHTALTLNPADWPLVAWKDRIQDLPRVAGFYCLWTDKALYIGESCNIHRRWYGGHKHRAIAAETGIRFYPYASGNNERQFVEWMLIIIHWPPLNTKRNLRQIWFDALARACWNPS